MKLDRPGSARTRKSGRQLRCPDLRAARTMRVRELYCDDLPAASMRRRYRVPEDAPVTSRFDEAATALRSAPLRARELYRRTLPAAYARPPYGFPEDTPVISRG